MSTSGRRCRHGACDESCWGKKWRSGGLHTRYSNTVCIRIVHKSKERFTCRIKFYDDVKLGWQNNVVLKGVMGTVITPAASACTTIVCTQNAPATSWCQWLPQHSSRLASSDMWYDKWITVWRSCWLLNVPPLLDTFLEWVDASLSCYD